VQVELAAALERLNGRPCAVVCGATTAPALVAALHGAAVTTINLNKASKAAVRVSLSQQLVTWVRLPQHAQRAATPRLTVARAAQLRDVQGGQLVVVGAVMRGDRERDLCARGLLHMRPVDGVAYVPLDAALPLAEQAAVDVILQKATDSLVPSPAGGYEFSQDLVQARALLCLPSARMRFTLSSLVRRSAVRRRRGASQSLTPCPRWPPSQTASSCEMCSVTWPQRRQGACTSRAACCSPRRRRWLPRAPPWQRCTATETQCW